MAIVQNTYTGNGSTTLYSLSFSYLDEADVKVTLNGVATTSFVFVNASTIQFLSAPANGVAIIIYRETNNDAFEATFFAGSAIKAADLNNNFTQLLYVAQEVFARTLSTLGGTLSGILNMGGYRITNLGTPSAGTDASTKDYVDSNVGAVSASAVAAAASAASASASAASATSSASSASTSASNASTSASNAAGSAAAALASQSAAAGSASTASTQASNASTSASNAATSATNASNSATSAASSAASALAAFDSFDDRYLGAKATDPTVDNDGDPLNAGDLYYNTTLSVMKVYTGSAWVMAYVPGDAASISFAPYSTIASNNVQGAIQELTDEKLNLTGGTLTGNLTAPAFIPNGSTAPSNGVYLPSANNVAISTNGTGRLFVDASGRVGIGSTSPTFAASYTGLHLDGGANGPVVRLTNSTTGSTATDGFDIILQQGGSDAYIWQRESAPIILGTAATERARIDSSGRLLVGTSTARSNFFNTTFASLFQVEGANDTGKRAASIVYGSNGDSGPILALGKTRSNSLGGNTLVASGDQCGYITFQGADGTELVEAAAILAQVDGTPGTNDMPGRLVFSTTADGASSPTERLRIANNGRVTVANSAIGTPTALTDAATVAVDLSLANYYTLTLGGNRTLGAPTNQTAGQSGVIVITNSGSYTLAYNSVWKFPSGTVPSVTASGVDVLAYYVESATRITARLLSDVK
jgi:hypothetical protein